MKTLVMKIRYLCFVIIDSLLKKLASSVCLLIMLSSELQVEKLKELSRHPNIYERLTRSLAPNIWELDDVKKGLLCQVIIFIIDENSICKYLGGTDISCNIYF